MHGLFCPPPYVALFYAVYLQSQTVIFWCYIMWVGYITWQPLSRPMLESAGEMDWLKLVVLVLPWHSWQRLIWCSVGIDKNILSVHLILFVLLCIIILVHLYVHIKAISLYFALAKTINKIPLFEIKRSMTQLCNCTTNPVAERT